MTNNYSLVVVDKKLKPCKHYSSIIIELLLQTSKQGISFFDLLAKCVTSVDLIPIYLKTSAILIRVVINISKTSTIILHLIVIVILM